MTPFYSQDSPQWKEMEDGGWPMDAFIAGSNEKEEPLFVARASHDNGLQPCQLREGHWGASLPYGGGEVVKPQYDVLVASQGLFWESITVGQLPADSLKTGNEANGNALYTIKYKTEGKTYIGKYNGNDKAYYVEDGKEKELTSGKMRILCFRAPSEKKVSMKVLWTDKILHF